MSGPYDTVWPADSVEFCPHEESRDIFVCGTYHLEQDPSAISDGNKQHRRGTCLVFQVASMETKSPSLVQEIALPAVLDQKWCHRSSANSPILGIADSEGNITIHEWRLRDRAMNCLQKIPLASDDILCLSLDWSNRRHPTDHLGSLVVSMSDGSLALLTPSSSDGLVISSRWHAHDYEPWISAWDYWESSVVYSGGDDLSLKGWDMRQLLTRPIFVNRRFDGGVTSIQSHPYVEHLIAVGSYDNSVRIFDTRKPSSPLTAIDVGGGAWRVKWHPSSIRKNDLLVACMHGGFKIAEIEKTERLLQNGMSHGIRRHFDEHESLAYGVDWSHQDAAHEETLIASCSFYDHALYLWSG
ncbi:WD40-repeat-containing domain protein [Scleroderma citrinum]